MPGGRLGDISAAIGQMARAAGYGLHTDFGGHGVGHTMHESPSVPNDGRAGRGLRLATGLVIAIEPWFMAGGHDTYRVDQGRLDAAAPVTAAGPRTSSTRSPSPTTARAS